MTTTKSLLLAGLLSLFAAGSFAQTPGAPAARHGAQPQHGHHHHHPHHRHHHHGHRGHGR